MGIGLNRILDRTAWYVLCVVVLLAPLAVGSVHQTVVTLWTAAACVGLVAYALLAFRQGRRVYFDGLVVLGLAAIAVMLLQLLPLGEGLLSRLSPVAWENVRHMRSLGVEIPTRLSLAPTETTSMLLLATCAIGLYLLSFNFAFRNSTSASMTGVVGTSGALVALATFLHATSSSDRILGFYASTATSPESLHFVSTFVNNNHGAAFLNLVLLAMVGMWRGSGVGRSRGLCFFLVVSIGAASFLMLSRAGILSLMVAVAIMGVFTQWSGPHKEHGASPAVVGFGAVVLLFCAFAFLALFNVVLVQTGGIELLRPFEAESKPLIWEKGLELLGTVRTAGAGAGAFGAAFSPFNNILPSVTIPHVENELLEPLVEFGTFIGIALVGTLAVLLFRRLLYSRSNNALLGIMCGVMAVWFHNLADFNIRIAGVLLPLVGLLGAVSGQMARAQAKRRNWPLAVSAAKVLPVSVLIMLLVIAASGQLQTRSWEATARTLNKLRLATSDPGSDSQRESQAILSLEDHPYDGHLLGLAALVYLNGGKVRTAAAMLERARALCPTCPLPIYGMVRLEQEAGSVEPMLERLLELQAVSLASQASVLEALQRSNISPRVIGSVWGKVDPDAVVSYARHLRIAGQMSAERELLQATMESGGKRLAVLRQLASNMIMAGDYDDADRVATWMLGLYPDVPGGYLLQGHICRLTNEDENALLMFKEAFGIATPGSPERLQAGIEMMRVLARTRHWPQFDDVAVVVRAELGDSNVYLSGYHKMIATKYQMIGRLPHALKELDLAESFMPLDESVMLMRGNLLLTAGESDRALVEFRKVLRLCPGNVTAEQMLRRLESNSPLGDHSPGLMQKP